MSHQRNWSRFLNPQRLCPPARTLITYPLCLSVSLSPSLLAWAFLSQKIPGVRYVPMVGKVTVAMLERNLLRLHENFGEGKCLFVDLRAIMYIFWSLDPALGRKRVAWCC